MYFSQKNLYKTDKLISDTSIRRTLVHVPTGIFYWKLPLKTDTAKLFPSLKIENWEMVVSDTVFCIVVNRSAYQILKDAMANFLCSRKEKKDSNVWWWLQSRRGKILISLKPKVSFQYIDRLMRSVFTNELIIYLKPMPEHFNTEYCKTINLI